MSAFILSGQKEAEKIKKSLKKQLVQIKKKLILAVVLIGLDPINKDYLNQLQKIGKQLGIAVLVKRFPNFAPGAYEKVASFIKRENRSHRTAGILSLVSPQSSLFKRREEIINLISPEKDFDCLRTRTTKLETIRDRTGYGIPSVCQAVLIVIAKAAEVLSFNPRWVKILVVGNQGFWGRRLQSTLKNLGFKNLSGVDRETTNLASFTQAADIIISCIGQPNLVKREMIKKGSTIIDLGGDVDFDEVKKVAGFITPVPGGIGPLSTILVFKNLLDHVQTPHLSFKGVLK